MGGPCVWTTNEVLVQLLAGREGAQGRETSVKAAGQCSWLWQCREADVPGWVLHSTPSIPSTCPPLTRCSSTRRASRARSGCWRISARDWPTSDEGLFSLTSLPMSMKPAGRNMGASESACLLGTCAMPTCLSHGQREGKVWWGNCSPGRPGWQAEKEAVPSSPLLSDHCHRKAGPS